MNSNHTATAHYISQFSIIFFQTGLQSDATGTVVKVNGYSKSYANLPYTLWVDSGVNTIYSYNSPVTSNITSKRYRLVSVTILHPPISITAPITVTGNYVPQYLVTFNQTGLDPTATGTVVTISGDSKNTRA